MKIGSLALITRLGALALVPLVAGCSDNSEDFLAPATPVVGTWAATSLMVSGADLIAEGMVLNATFDDSGIYVFHVVKDMLGLCGGDTECDVTGDFTATTTEVTLNPGEDPTTINYVSSGDTLTLTGTMASEPVTIAFKKFGT